MSYQFSVELPCKSYVKRYIEQNFGKPTRFYADKATMSYIRLLLERNVNRSVESLISKDIYTDSLTFYINESDYNHYGCNLADQAIIEINKFFEARVKSMMHTWCATHFRFGFSAAEAVRKFQDECNFPEDVWKFETIYKDCRRCGIFSQRNSRPIHETIHKIILRELSENRTITRLGKKHYENNRNSL